MAYLDVCLVDYLAATPNKCQKTITTLNENHLTYWQKNIKIYLLVFFYHNKYIYLGYCLLNNRPAVRLNLK